MKVNEYDIPSSWLEASDKERKGIANGCGPGSWKYDLVPDTIYGLNITKICDWHDFDYTFLPKTRSCKDIADRRMHHNLKVHISLHSVFILKPFRYARAYLYYLAVSKGGDSSFFEEDTYI